MKRQKLLFVLILVLTAIVVLALNILTPLIADDYLYLYSIATRERITGVAQIFPSMAAHATVMNGRLIPDFLVQLFLLLPHGCFILVNTLMFLVFLLGAYRLLAGDERHNWLLLLALDGALLVLPPVFGQTSLWLTGAINYLWRDALLTWVMVPFADYILRGRRLKSLWLTVPLALASVFVGDSIENVSAAAIFILLLCLVWLRVRKRGIPVYLLVSLLSMALGWALLMLSPSNAKNVAQSSASLGRLTEHFQQALIMWNQYGLWLSLGYIVLFFAAARLDTLGPDRLFLSAAVFLGSLVCAFIMAGADYYPERAAAGMVILLILAIGLLLAAIRFDRGIVLRALAFSLGLLLAINMAGALPGTYGRYKQAAARAAEVRAQCDAGVTDVVTYGIKGFSKYDAFYGLNELTENPAYFPNVFFAKYFGLNTVVVDRYY